MMRCFPKVYQFFYFSSIVICIFSLGLFSAAMADEGVQSTGGRYEISVECGIAFTAALSDYESVFNKEAAHRKLQMQFSQYLRSSFSRISCGEGLGDHIGVVFWSIHEDEMDGGASYVFARKDMQLIEKHLKTDRTGRLVIAN